MKQTCLKIFAVLFCFVSIFCTACSKKDSFIDISTYFDDIVEYNTFSSATNFNFQLDSMKEFNENKLAQYKTLKLTTMKDYSFGLTVHYLTFDVYSTETEQIELIIDITNMKNATYNTVYSAKTFSKAVPLTVKQNDCVSVKVEIEDEWQEGISKIIFNNNSAEKFITNNNLKICFSNIQICAEHL